MIILNITFILSFLIAAALQYNDPDPYLWVPLYLYGAYLCFLSIRKKFIPLLFILGIIIYASYAVILLFDDDSVISWASEHNAENIVQSMKATKPWIEKTREFFGLLLLFIASSVNILWLRKQNKSYHYQAGQKKFFEGKR